MKISFAFLALAAVVLSDVVQANFNQELKIETTFTGQINPTVNVADIDVSEADVQQVGEQIADVMKGETGLRRELRQQDHRKLFDLNVVSFFFSQPEEVPCSFTPLGQIAGHTGTCVAFTVSYTIILENINAADYAEFMNQATGNPAPASVTGVSVTDEEELKILRSLVASLLGDTFDNTPICDNLIVDDVPTENTCAAAEVGTKLIAVVGESRGDPHFKTFSGDWYDFHGECDLVLIDVPDYSNQSGLAVYIRTTVRYAYSFIETIAIKVGEDILQVSSWGDYMINGISNAELEGATLNGLPVTREAISEKQFEFVVTLANGHHFTVKVFKDLISTSFDLPEEHSVLGLLGNRKGDRVARDGITVMEEPNEFGQEWQVQDTDHQLFAAVREPQFPTKCIMPDPVEREQRRLSATVSQEAAEAACSHIKDEHVRDMCIFDVISVDDLSLAAGAY